MGEWEGHVYPGSFYILMALWWNINTTFKHILRRVNEKRLLSSAYEYEPSTTHSFFFLPSRFLRRLPLESCLKLIGFSYHALTELLMGLKQNENHKWTIESKHAHHVCMMSGYYLASIVEICIHFGLPLPQRSEYVFNLIGFLIQSMIMLMGHDDPNYVSHLEMNAHHFWSLLIFLTFISFALEFTFPKHYWAMFLRNTFFMCQGTWLIGVGYIIWPPSNNQLTKWMYDNETSYNWLKVYLTAHLLFCFLFMFSLNIIIYYSVIYWLRKKHKTLKF